LGKIVVFYFQQTSFFGTMTVVIYRANFNYGEKMETGKVKFFNKSKRYGFISGDNGNDYFFHDSGLSEGIYVQDGDKVEFKIVDGDRGQKAVEISIID
jgi:CspA family cold shock protein